MYDYVEQHPVATSDACKITQFILSANNVTLNYNVRYDKKGNMLSVVAEEGSPLYMNFDKYFRYDKHNRLTDYILAYHGNPIAFSWQSIQYFKDKTVDTVYVNCGDITSPAPPVNAPADKKFFSEATTDSWGRVISITVTNNGNAQQVFFQYNSEGNLVTDPVTSYDNKINPYRTNSMATRTKRFQCQQSCWIFGIPGLLLCKNCEL
jgi:hypothetical protein